MEYFDWLEQEAVDWLKQEAEEQAKSGGRVELSDDTGDANETH